MRDFLTNTFRNIRYLLMIVISLSFFTCTSTDNNKEITDIIIENAEMRLILNSNGTASSLIHTASGQECLDVTKKMPVFSITQYRPYDSEVMLAYPAKEMKFAADSIYRVGDDLIVSFELTDYEATVGLNITDNYIGFTLKKLEYHMADFGVKRRTEIDEFTLMQLPVKEQEHTLLINEQGDFELVPYKPITEVANGNPDVRAFTFVRNGKTWVTYWHCRGDADLVLPVSSNKMQLFKELGKESLVENTGNNVVVPVGDRRYIAFDLSLNEVVNLFAKARIQ